MKSFVMSIRRSKCRCFSLPIFLDMMHSFLVQKYSYFMKTSLSETYLQLLPLGFPYTFNYLAIVSLIGFFLSFFPLQCCISQHCELTMVGAQYSCKVARLETKDGCPLGPGASLNRTFTMKPLAQMCTHERGLALDASLSKVRTVFCKSA